MRAWWTLASGSPIEVQRPRSIAEIIGAALSLYRRHPVLFLVLALAVTAPYELIVLAALGSAPIGSKRGNASTALILILVEVALVTPLISALYAHAVVMIGRGEQPSPLTVAARVMRVLPVVVAAEIAAGFGIGLGLLAFLIPGVILLIRWAVVAQAAALEHPDWIGALRRSGDLTRGNYRHVFGLLVLTTVVNLGLSEVASAAAGGTGASDVIIAIAVATVVRSFTALTTAILYFDLLAREAGLPAAREAGPPAAR
jgi:hypothetical protein